MKSVYNINAILLICTNIYPHRRWTFAST